MVSLKEATPILNITELIFSIIVGGLWGNLPTGMEPSKYQLINGVLYGYIIMNIILCIAIITTDKIPKNVRMLISGPGFFLWLTASALILEAYDNMKIMGGEFTDRHISAGIIGLATSLVYAVDTFLVFKES